MLVHVCMHACEVENVNVEGGAKFHYGQVSGLGEAGMITQPVGRQ